MYGRAIGGIVDVQIKKLQPKKIAGYADVNLFDTSVYLEAPLGDKGGVAIAGRRSYLDFVLNAAVPSDAPINLIDRAALLRLPGAGQLPPGARARPARSSLGSDDRFAILFKNPGDVSTQVTGNAVLSRRRRSTAGS